MARWFSGMTPASQAGDASSILARVTVVVAQTESASESIAL